MHKIINLSSLDQYFSQQRENNVIFYRIAGYTQEVSAFLEQFYMLAKKNGVVIEGKIQNPTESNLEYYDAIIGKNFELQEQFFSANLKKWLPRLGEANTKNIAGFLFVTLNDMKQRGKSDGILKNAYIKYMCWLYYKFEQVVLKLSQNVPVQLIYQGDISTYELELLSILSKCGCDIVILEYQGDEGYRKLDPTNQKSILYEQANLGPFPENYSLQQIQQQAKEKEQIAALLHTKTGSLKRTNQWITSDMYEDILTPCDQRGSESECYYNAFFRMTGVEDKVHFQTGLYNFLQKLKAMDRKVVLEDGDILPPSPNEISKIKAQNFNDNITMLKELKKEISYTSNLKLQEILQDQFVELLKEDINTLNVNKFKSRAVSLIALFNRYKEQLFTAYKGGKYPAFLLLNGTKNPTQVLLVAYLARLPVDVFILCPNLSKMDISQDALLYEKKYDHSVALTSFPEENDGVRLTTVAFEAEQDLNQILYSDGTAFRDFQHKTATSISLRTMFEEIGILWKEPAQFRQNFSVLDDNITLPVICAKIVGVREGNKRAYWDFIREFITKDTIVVNKVPFYTSKDCENAKPFATQFFKNGKLDRAKIMNHKSYQFSHLREDMQKFILDKLQLLIDSKLIKGCLQNGTEYSIIATILSLNVDMVRMIQKFDFTKDIPKLIWVDTTETMYSLEDSAVIGFLNLIGFDILLFTPTGYEKIEKHYTRQLFENHTFGEIMYDLEPPTLQYDQSKNEIKKWTNKLFGRGT